MIRLLYLARLREALGRRDESVDLPADVQTVEALVAWLRARGGAWARELAPARPVRVAVNHDVADGSTPVAAGDEIAFFPPVTGG